ncbi:MAG: UbiD family decarboxylase [Planctomycetaceae bacterium]
MKNYDNLADFIAELEDDGELVRVSAEVDPELELTEVTRRILQSASDGPAIFFEHLRGHSMPVVVNLLGSERRMLKALRTDSFAKVAERIASLIQPELPEGWLEAVRLVPQLSQLTRLPPKMVRTALCQQVVRLGRDVDLTQLPTPRFWPGDAAPTITMGQVYTKNPRTGIRDIGMLTVEVRDHNTLTICWDAHHDARRAFDEYKAQGQQMPVAIALGGDPILSYVANVPLPANTDESLLAGFLRGSNIELVKCRSVDLEVPATAEIVIEGVIDTSLPLETAGPMACPTGFYDEPEEVPLVAVTALTHRSNPIFPARIFSSAPSASDDYWISRATEQVFLPFVRLFIPEIVDLHQPRAGVSRNLAFVSIRKEYPQQARKVMHALWSLPAFMVSKILVVVDADIDVRDAEQVWFRAGANAHPGRDVVMCEGPTHFSDHAAPVRGLGHKMGIDATRKLPGEGHSRSWPGDLQMDSATVENVARRWAEYGFKSKQ